jgi:hypothetical protein
MIRSAIGRRPIGRYGIIVGCLDVDDRYKYSLLFGRRLIWLMSIIVDSLNRGSNNFTKIMPIR